MVLYCDTQLLQSLAFIAGYTTHQYLKHSYCHICQDLLTIDKNLIIDDTSTPQFKLMELFDRGGLKYPSEIVLDSIIVVWQIFIIIEHNSELMIIFLNGPSRKILVDLTLNYLENSEGFEIWRNSCASCRVCVWSIVRRLVFVASNCLIANKVKITTQLLSQRALRSVS